MKIAIIGGGAAGLTTAWLLEQQHEVTLFEKLDRLGGHAHTKYLEVEGQILPVEIGFEFFNKNLYPTFCRLLEILEVPTSSYYLDYVFFTSDQKQLFFMPHARGLDFITRTVCSPRQLFNLLQLYAVFVAGKKVLRTKQFDITIDEFMHKWWMTNSFKNNFFFPFFSAAWGAEISELKTFSMYDLLAWVLPNKSSKTHWYHVVDGMSFYIDTLAKQLIKTKVKYASPVADIADVDGLYAVRTAHEQQLFDAVIFAANSYEAAELLAQLSHAREQKDILQNIEYISATLAIHGDVRYMPDNRKFWCNSNVQYNGERSTLTIYDFWKTTQPVFRSWLMPEFPEPAPVYATEHFYHPKPTPAYFKAQELLVHVQGKNNIWFAGMYTNGIDSHESAIQSAVNIAQKLAPSSERLGYLSTTV